MPNISFLENCFDIEKLLDWVQTVDEFFKIVSVPFEEQATLVFSGLEDVARYWWRQLQKERKNHGKFPILSWSRMMNEFLVNFYVPQIEPPNERECYVGFGAYDVYL